MDGDSTGLVNKSGKDWFGGYLVFPIMKGKRVVGVTSRFPGPSGSMPPHMHLQHDTMRTAFNWNAMNNETVFIVESPICCMSMHQATITNTIAIMGSSSGEIKLLDALQKEQEIILVPDNDWPGYKAFLTLGSQLIEEGFRKVKFIHPTALGECSDINDFIANHNYDELIDVMKWGRINLLEWAGLKGIRKPLPQISKERRRELKAHNEESIIDVIQEHAIIEKIGQKFKCVCPFHADGNASLMIYEETNTWFCFGCRKGGGPSQFKKALKGESE